MSIQFIVEMRDAGCDCCSYITVGSFETVKEAKDYIGDDSNLRLTVDASDEDESIISMAEAIQRVRELHKPYAVSGMSCSCCKLSTECSVCDETYPCDTIKALEGEQK